MDGKIFAKPNPSRHILGGWVLSGSFSSRPLGQTTSGIFTAENGGLE